MLRTNPYCRGVGITLPEEEGGHSWGLTTEYGETPTFANDVTRRFELVWHNILAYDLGPPNHAHSGEHPAFPLAGRSFDLVLLDGHLLRTRVQDDYARSDDWSRLLWSQLLIGLQCVAEGGTVVMKLSRAENIDTARVLYILERVSGELIAKKPGSVHRDRGTFYIVAKSVQQSRQLDEYVAALQDLWYEMTHGGKDGTGLEIPRYLVLENVVPWGSLTSADNLERLSALCRDAWLTQLRALQSISERERKANFGSTEGRVWRRGTGSHIHLTGTRTPHI